MEPGALFIVRLHPLPSTNVLMVVSSLMALLTQGHTTLRGQDTVRYCIILSVSIYLFMEPYKGYKSAIIFSLPELIKQRLLQGKNSNFITRDIVEGNLTKQKPEFYQKGQ